MGMPYLPTLPAMGRLLPSAEDLARVALIEARLLTEISPDAVAALREWVAYGKGLRALLLQFSRSRPGKPPDDVEEAFALLARAAEWRRWGQGFLNSFF